MTKLIFEASFGMNLSKTMLIGDTTQGTKMRHLFTLVSQLHNL